MEIQFSRERMEKVKDTYRRWSEGSLGRPILAGQYKVRHVEDPLPHVPLFGQSNCHDWSISPEEVVEKFHHYLCTLEFVGDAYPYINMDWFGPGILATFCGGRLDNRSGGCWFYPPEDRPPIHELHIKYDPDSPWAQRIKAICRAAMDRWQGQVLIGDLDLGGTMDVVSTFLPNEELPLALYDEPEEVERLVWEVHEAWLAAYADFEQFTVPQGAYTNWMGILTCNRSSILQCDFSYMIGRDMFRRFALEEIRATGRALGQFDYHLDGIGSLPHLDDLLDTPELRMMQWVPGDGKPHGAHWNDLYNHILEKGKLAAFVGNAAQIEQVLSDSARPEAFYFWEHHNDRATLERLIARYTVG